uniref:CN hydrolase domain-containing protein n=1 Tax=Octactis speculum TaxID=3111310 RepID=A0A7S2FVR5_9STRA|mmetsp:Transcript_31728/g.42989  ORF Transcript_31728/g.42989 Transcript_31728/m.42989 type:complete len:280 (+) Transcript_31728:90-929(+)
MKWGAFVAISGMFVTLETVAGSFGVSALSNHDSTAWNSDRNCSSAVQCNLLVYEDAITLAAAQGAKLMVFPEGYSLSPDQSEIEPWISIVGEAPCDIMDLDSSPAQIRISCAARKNRLTVLANIFVLLPNGTTLMTDVVFDDNGTVVATYSKHHLFPTEKLHFSPGPYSPTLFPLEDFVFGLIICYEGIWPLTWWGDWEQMEDLVTMGATHFIWSIGGAVPLPYSAAYLAEKFETGVLAAEGEWAAAILGTDGLSVDTNDFALFVEGYTANASVRVGFI